MAKYKFKIVRIVKDVYKSVETMEVFTTIEEAVIALKNRKRNYDTSCTDDVVESNETMFKCFSFNTLLNKTIEQIFAIVENAKIEQMFAIVEAK